MPNSEDYAKLGKRIKSENPGRWDGNTDEEVGIVHWKFREIKGEPSNFDPRPTFFVETRANHVRKQIDYTDAKLRQNDQIKEAPRRFADAVKREHAVHTGEMAAHETALTKSLADKLLIEKAVGENMDVPTLMLDTLAENASKRNVREAWEREQIRILGYEHEVKIDMQAALGMHMLDVEKIDYISGKIALLKSQDADPERIGVMERIREQMERRVLDAPEPEQLENPNDET